MTAPSLDGRWFRSTSSTGDGEVDGATLFRYSEEAGEVWGVYAGGRIRRGYLVGTRAGDRMDLRYVHLNEAGQTLSGHSVSTVSVRADGLLRLEETWQWESRQGAGTSVVEEIPPS